MLSKRTVSSTLSVSIAQRILQEQSRLRDAFQNARPFRHCFIDDVLPEEILKTAFSKLPSTDSMLLRSSLRERKRVRVDFSSEDPLFSELLQAFHAPEVIAAIAQATGIQGLVPDPSLYASGISVMKKGDFLNPHLDNSHDGDQKLYRSLNTLFYITPGWPLEDAAGGHLELWTPGLGQRQLVKAKFNRLVIMETHTTSWHSVNPVTVDKTRVCVSNYYFVQQPPGGNHYRHVTTFRGRPEQKLRDLTLRLDGWLRNQLGKHFPSLLTKTKHRLPSK